MSTIDALVNYIDSSSLITVGVLLSLSLYFILIFWVFVYRYMVLGSIQKRESVVLETLMMGAGARLGRKSLLSSCLSKGVRPTREAMAVCRLEALKNTTKGLAFLSIVASTSPFIGLFGTVVSILESFAQFGEGMQASLAVIAPVISEALVATAAGILVAIPAYSFHLVIKRKSFEIMNLLQIEIDLLLTHSEPNDEPAPGTLKPIET